jgi:hypothetical protein
MAAYGLAIFLGAFLLFQVQPLIGKFLLPWFGGAPGVWTTCMLFFQVLLLGGYGYAHLSSRWLKPRTQAAVHLGLIALGLITLPIMPDASWKPLGNENPTLRILALLALNVGLPYFALSATAPLLQNWFSRTLPGQSPYRLYALSNFGSLLALVSYPVVVETTLTRTAQSTAWGMGLGIYFLSCLWAALKVWKPGDANPEAAAKAPVGERPSGRTMALWVLLPFCASALLLAITNKICQDVAVIAFLWVLPLAVYLLSFIICFERSAWYRRFLFGSLLMMSLPLMALLLSEQLPLSVPAQIAVYVAGLFACCMVCHGEVYRLRPHPAFLTTFYLMIAAGGALGGVFVALVAPRIFSDFFELHWGLLLAGGVFLGLWARKSTTFKHPPSLAGWLASAAVCLLTAALLWRGATRNSVARVSRERNFYGVLSVYRHDFPDATRSQVEMMHGRIAHGMQYLHPARSGQPTLYYSAGSGVAKAFQALAGTNRHIGVVGLGAGTLAACGKPGDRIRFYEINPDVETAARKHFSYLKNSQAAVEVTIGDARLSLEREPSQAFDLLVLDAFSGDAIPAHLLTREAFEIYRRHLKPGGILAAHISNMSLDLEPVVLRQATDGGWTAVVIDQPRADYDAGVLPSIWALLSQDPGFANLPPIREASRPDLQAAARGPAWTDDYSALLPLLRRGTAPAAGAKSSVLQVESAANFAHGTNAAATLARFQEDLARNPESASAMNNLAVMLATAPEAGLRNGAEAVRLAEKANALTGNEHPAMLTTLAAAYAEAGRFGDAIRTAETAIKLAGETSAEMLVARNRQLLEYYRRGEAYHQQDKASQ